MNTVKIPIKPNSVGPINLARSNVKKNCDPFKTKVSKNVHFNPEKVLSHFHSNQPNKQLRKIVVSLKGPGKAECEQVLMVGDGE